MALKSIYNTQRQAPGILWLGLLLLLLLPFGAYAQTPKHQSAIITGTVHDNSGAPLSLVNIQMAGTHDGAVSDSSGHFTFTTHTLGRQFIIASIVGFEKLKQVINIKSGKRISINFTLREKLQQLSESQVTASSFTTGDAKGVTLHPLEVVTTPGAAGDIFRAVKTLPGVSTVDQGAGLFVRGGDVSETKILLDQATVVHPYRFESPTGGARGTIPPFLVSGTYFSSGGFSARYGNALSAILALHSLGMPQVTTVDLNLGMAAASASLSIPLFDDKLGLRFSGNRSFTQFLFDVNGQADEFQQAPLGLDGNLSLIYQPLPHTTIKFFNFAQRSKIGVRTEESTFEGLFNSDETNRLHNLQWKQSWNNTQLTTSFSFNQFDSKRKLGGFNLHEQDNIYKIRTDFKRLLLDDLQILAGGEWNFRQNNFIGSVPDQHDVYNPEAAFTRLDNRIGADRVAAYMEVKFRPFRNITANISLRSDLQTQAGQAVIDPRLNISYRLNNFTHLRFATGVYHQFPEPFQYNPETGNPVLKAQRAWHYILGFERKKKLLHLRIEGYYKDYDHLVINDNTKNISNHGYGYAQGFDVFLKYSKYLKTRFNGWISYSFLQSKRYQAQDVSDQYIFHKAPSDFDITHNLNVVGKVRLVDNLYVETAYRFATGRPVTPITGADFIKKGEAGYYRPVEGSVNSQRLPSFQRLDLSISYYWPFATHKSATFYFSVSNVLDRDNVTGYTYNKNYSQRQPVISHYLRSVYTGVSLNLGL